MKVDFAKTRKGFTFLELILVIALVAILVLSTSPFYSRFYMVTDVAQAKNRLLSILHKAQSYSLAGRDNSAWNVVLSGNQVTLVRQSDSHSFDSFNFNSNITISNFGTLSFSKPTGIPASAITITLSARNSTKTITVSSQGAIGE